MHFLVFIPGTAPEQLQDVARVAGLSTLIDGANVLPNVQGPGDKPGLMLGWTKPHSPFTHYEPDAQDWVSSFCKDENGDSRYWVGFWKQADGQPPRRPPTESELRRDYSQDGFWHRSGTERWEIVTPRTVDMRLAWQDDGGWKWEPLKQYAWLAKESEQMLAKYTEEGFLRLQVCIEADPMEQAEWMLKLLQVNYRMLPEVMVYLDIFRGKRALIKAFLTSIGIEPKDEIMTRLYGYAVEEREVAHA